jgi:transcriptional regulator with XRE-family HTH domain
MRTELTIETEPRPGEPVAKTIEVPVREFARRAGVSHTQISRIESGAIAKPAIEQLIGVARAAQRRPEPLLILAGHLTGEDARVELTNLFYDSAELRDAWGDWAHFSWEDASRLVREPGTPFEQLQLIAYDVFTAGETAETLWEDQEQLLATGQPDLRSLLGTWRFLTSPRRKQLLDYSRAVRRVQELEELADNEAWQLEAAQLPAPASPTAAFSEQRLADLGFEGFARVVGLPTGAPGVPSAPGVYVVVRRGMTEPRFLDRSVGGRFKGQDPSVPVERLNENWVDAATVLYIGRGSDLRSRLNLLARFGRGEPVAHWGGRFLWQLEDHRDLLVAWLETTDQVNRESELIATFEDSFGALPFANLNRPSSAS